MIKHHRKKIAGRSFIWFVGAAGCFVVHLIGAPIVGSWIPDNLSWTGRMDPVQHATLKQMERLGILEIASPKAVSEAIDYQRRTGKTLARILREPGWSERLGLSAETFKATWYIANPFDILPGDLQQAIRDREIPFRSRTHVWQWCRQNNVPQRWREALYLALIETTPINLWRASRGKRPYTKSGAFLEPIVVDHGSGRMEVRDGHIATDPRIIPTNEDVLLIMKIEGKERILKVRAADIGAAIKGHHVDLPIHVGPETERLPFTRLPAGQIRNPVVRILRTNRANPNQKV